MNHRTPRAPRRPAVVAIALLALSICGGLATGSAPVGATVPQRLAAAPLPTLTMSPAGPYDRPTLVTGTAAGLVPGQTVFFGLCTDPPPFSNWCDASGPYTVETDGTLTVHGLARPVMTASDPSPRPVDCRASGCSFTIVEGQDFTVVASAPALFTTDADPNAASPPTVIPSTGLTDGQTVVLDIPPGNLPPNQPYSFGQCQSPIGEMCAYTFPTAYTDPIDGHLTIEIQVFRTLPHSAEGYDSRPEGYDCLTDPCVIALGVAQAGIGPLSRTFPISFAGPTTTTTASTTTVATTPSDPTSSTEPLPAPGSTTTTASTTTTEVPFEPSIVAVNPTAGAPGEVVTVTGTNFVPGGTSVQFGDQVLDATVARRLGGRAVYDSLTFTIPDVDPGQYLVQVLNAGGASNTQTFTVTERTPTTTPGPTSAPSGTSATTGGSSSGSSGLARSGTSVVPLAEVGLLLLMLGLVALGWSRRRAASAGR